MKIKYEISEKSQLNQQVLKDEILSQLAKRDYLIINKSNNIISFKDDIWRIRPKGTGLKKVDQGIFELVSLDDVTLIRYTYYISFLPEVVITAIIVFGAVTLSYLVLIIALPLWIQLGVRIYTLKDVSAQMVKRLAS
jgi:hypothetical protein